MARLLFIGSVCADVILCLPHLPRTGEDINLQEQQVSLGGCAFNAFSAARHFGVEAALFAPVGSGLWGDWVRGALQKRGIETLIPPSDAPNGCCYCLVDSEGERTFLCEHGAEYRFRPEWTALLENETFDAVYLCGLEVEEPTGDVLLDYLEAHPPRRLYFAPGPRLCHILPERMARICALHPVMHLNALELLQFTRQDTVALGAAVLSQVTGGDVVVTLGPQGAYILMGERARTIPPVPAQVQDTIGAGDAHIGAVMACEALGMDLEQAVVQANRVSAAVISQAGAELPHDTFLQWMK